MVWGVGGGVGVGVGEGGGWRVEEVRRWRWCGRKEGEVTDPAVPPGLSHGWGMGTAA